jgi:hypothetical protein
VIFVIIVLTKDILQLKSAENDLTFTNSVDDLLEVLKKEKNWDLFSKENFRINQLDDVFLVTELLGAIRSEKSFDILLHVEQYPTMLYVLPQGFRNRFVAAALIRIINNGQKINILLHQVVEQKNIDSCMRCLQTLLPLESSLVLIDYFIETEIKESNKNEKNLFGLFLLRKRLYLLKNTTLSPLPKLSDFTLNHPLYKARQSAIELNLTVLKDQKKIIILDTKTLSAIAKLGELRAAEAVETLTPKLLLKPDSSVKLNNDKIAEKYDSIKDYPVAVALAEIGIPSLWGLLNEIAANHHDEPYYQTAYQTMTAILPDVAIPGFVNESLKKHTGEIAQLRLYKMYSLMGLPIEGTPLIPQLREWQSTDKLFKTTAKFVSLDNGDVTLEKTDSKRTTIEFSVLRKEDQDYVKEQTTTVKKPIEKEKK